MVIWGARTVSTKYGGENKPAKTYPSVSSGQGYPEIILCHRKQNSKPALKYFFHEGVNLETMEKHEIC